MPGRWSSYPPHHHPQPEIYHYRFTMPQGYGHRRDWRPVVKVRHMIRSEFRLGSIMRQCAAPGYGMYYSWVIGICPKNLTRCLNSQRNTAGRSNRGRITGSRRTREVEVPERTPRSRHGRSGLCRSYGNRSAGGSRTWRALHKYIGGCPANIAIGAARLGPPPGFLSRVGDEAHGPFHARATEREGVDMRHLKTDAARLTALVILGIRDRENFPLIFYRENCADMALEEGDVHESYIFGAGAVVVTGTHFSTPKVAAAKPTSDGLGPCFRRRACRSRYRLPSGAVESRRTCARRPAVRRQ